MRYVIGILALLIAGCATTGKEIETDEVGALSIVDSLSTWAKMTGYQIVVPQCANEVPARGAVGKDAVDLLVRLLEGSGLGYTFINEKTVAIRCN